MSFLSKQSGVGGSLSESRKEFYQSLSTFFSQVQYIISIYVAIFTVAIGALYFFLKEAPKQYALLTATGLFLILSALIVSIASRSMKATYQLYIAGVIYSAQLHKAADAGKHLWFDWIQNYVDKNPTASKRKITKLWMQDRGSTFTSYQWVVRVLGCASAGAGVVLFAWSASYWSEFGSLVNKLKSWTSLLAFFSIVSVVILTVVAKRQVPRKNKWQSILVLGTVSFVLQLLVVFIK